MEPHKHSTNTTADRVLREAAAMQNARPPWADCQAEGSKRSITPFELVDSVTGSVGALAKRVADIADKLVGVAPTPDGPLTANVVRLGQLGALADRADSIDYAVNAMHQHLNRIEAQLP